MNQGVKDMKIVRLVPLLVSLLASLDALAQDPDWGSWTFQPRLSLGKLFPGSPVNRQLPAFEHPVFFPQTQLPNGVSQYRYEGTSLGFSVRAFPSPVEWVAITLGGGVTWYYGVEHDPVYGIQAATTGTGEHLAPNDFMVFPISLGAQAVYPGRERASFMLFAGVEGTANFISGDVPMDEQVKPGFGAVAGFAVRVFEVGIRYDRFSDLTNLGGYLAVRLNPFDVRLFGDSEGNP